MNARVISLLLACAASLGARADSSVSVAFEQRIGAKLPLAAEFIDETGARHALGDFFQGQPIVLIFDYARCPQLCSVVADATVEILRRLRLSAGRDFSVIALSIDPGETLAEAQSRQRTAIARYGRSDSARGWHALIGDEPNIRAIADAAGFRFTYDPRARQFAHPAGFVILTGEGVVSRYFPGVDFAADDVASALARAAAGKTGEPVFNLVLRCFRGDGVGGRYGKIIWAALTLGVALTTITLAGGIGRMLWQERRRLTATNAKGAP
jgi:protein SCO1/2